MDLSSEMSDGAPVERLEPGARPLPAAEPSPPRQVPAGAAAAALARLAQPGRRKLFVHLASSDRRAEELGRALTGIAPGIEVLVLPPWDCLPYDRASPSRDVMGRRMQVMTRLMAASTLCVLVVSPDALIQRLPPAEVVAGARFPIVRGQPLDREALAAFAAATGYVVDDRIDEPGEIAILGEVVDIFPADAARPLRLLTDEGGVVTEIRVFDPISQRTDGDLPAFTLGPASELVLVEPVEPRAAGAEHRMPETYGDLPSLFDLLPATAVVTRDERFTERLDQMLEQVGDAFEAHRSLRAAGDAAAPEPSRLYLDDAQVTAGVSAWTARDLDLVGVEAMTNFALAANPGRAFCDLVAAQTGEGRRVLVTGLKHELSPLARALSRGLQLTPEPATTWQEIAARPPGSVSSLQLDLDTGYFDPAQGLCVIAAADVLGGRLVDRRSQGREALISEPDLRIGDVVLHEDHGVGVLRELQTVEIDGTLRDTLRLEYAGGASVLAPAEEIGRIWRYGAEAAAVKLDKLGGDAWPKRRAEVHHHLAEVAERMVELATARARATCAPVSPPKAPYARFAARFGYPETPDQAAAIEAVLADLASGRPMDRLICGDVGFGKTEVALRAAAAVALSGRQVAVCAPTTVLAKQHFQTFQRRFAGTGIKVEQLSRLVAPATAKAVREAVAAGEVGIVVGTHALASEKVSFADLGLMIIDEEQKFGAAMKQRLRDLAEGDHLLSMTATPIPRTLQAAMVGVQEVSVIASPPARRRPIRTFLAPFEPASVRTALMREARRGGQSFLVTPRIEDVGSLATQLSSLVPELQVRIAHGGLPADEVDAVMVGFAEGEGDVLLATNIIESGLDVPRANTMLIWRPDRFGLSQLHQLRGRVGRGRAQGIAYLLSDPAEELSDATRARLSTLEAFDRLGAGLAISARDLDLRGGGDLAGEDQAGHMQMIGAALYQRLLDHAIRVAKGEPLERGEAPVIDLGETGAIPVDFVPDAIIRINLYARLARLMSVNEVDAFEEELQDRFGKLPNSLESLLAFARLTCLARAARIRQVTAGPRAIALTPHPGTEEILADRLAKAAPDLEVKAGRLIVPRATEAGEARVAAVERLLAAVAEG